MINWIDKLKRELHLRHLFLHRTKVLMKNDLIYIQEISFLSRLISGHLLKSFIYENSSRKQSMFCSTNCTVLFVTRFYVLCIYWNSFIYVNSSSILLNKLYGAKINNVRWKNIYMAAWWKSHKLQNIRYLDVNLHIQ